MNIILLLFGNPIFMNSVHFHLEAIYDQSSLYITHTVRHLKLKTRTFNDGTCVT